VLSRFETETEFFEISLTNLFGDQWSYSIDTGRLGAPVVRKPLAEWHLVSGTRDEIAPRFHAEVQHRIADGYVYTYFGMPIREASPVARARNAELEASARGNDDAMMVYADWLMSRGDSRGDIIASDPNSLVDRGTKPIDWLATDEAKQMWSRVADDWRQLLGELLAEHSAQLYRLDLGWRLGHLTKIEVAPETSGLVPPTAELLARIRAHPIACFLD
jgi:hypothetical protein